MFTPREIEIAGRVVTGQKREAIARDLGISPRTVRFHLENMRRKASVCCVVSLAVWIDRHPAICGSYSEGGQWRKLSTDN